jgi:hypothetical protein
MFASAVFLLLQVPPVEAVVKASGVPIQTVEFPLTGNGGAATVTVKLGVTVEQKPFATVRLYAICAVPAEIPVATPVREPTVATAVLSLVQYPPVDPVGSVYVVVWPIHPIVEPTTVPGTAAVHNTVIVTIPLPLAPE